jgi:hypothetical protein
MPVLARYGLATLCGTACAATARWLAAFDAPDCVTRPGLPARAHAPGDIDGGTLAARPAAQSVARRARFR